MQYRESSRYYNVVNYECTQIPLTVTNSTYDYTHVLSDEAGRLDLVSLRIYNDPSYWWLIAMFNGIIDPSIVPVGLRLRIPNLSIS